MGGCFGCRRTSTDGIEAEDGGEDVPSCCHSATSTFGARCGCSINEKSKMGRAKSLVPMEEHFS